MREKSVDAVKPVTPGLSDSEDPDYRAVRSGSSEYLRPGVERTYHETGAAYICRS